VAANVTTELVQTFVTLILSRRMLPVLRFRMREIQWRRAWELASFEAWNLLTNIAYRLRELIIMLILNRWASPEAAVWSVGILGRRQIEAWLAGMAGPLVPVVTGMHAIGAGASCCGSYC
jgi:O-antigen/teichoic acid export membrane protein